jgi:phage terminase small subunit
MKNKVGKKKPKISSRTTLTQKQEDFCLNYIELGNATQAAIKAGYKPKNADVTAAQNLRKPSVIERLNQLRKAAEDNTVMNVLERKQRLSEIARAKLTDFMEMGADGTWCNIGPESEHAGAVQEISSRTEKDDKGEGETVFTKVKLHDPIKAIDLLNKMDKIYAPEGTGNTININIDKMLVDARGKLESIINRIAARTGETGTPGEPK